MNIVVNEQVERKLSVGDIIEYEGSTRRRHGFYMVCHSEDEGYFVMSLTGQKEKLRFYKTLDRMLAHQSNISKVYSKEEWEIRLSKTS